MLDDEGMLKIPATLKKQSSQGPLNGSLNRHQAKRHFVCSSKCRNIYIFLKKKKKEEEELHEWTQITNTVASLSRDEQKVTVVASQTWKKIHQQTFAPLSCTWRPDASVGCGSRHTSSLINHPCCCYYYLGLFFFHLQDLFSSLSLMENFCWGGWGLCGVRPRRSGQ